MIFRNLEPVQILFLQRFLMRRNDRNILIWRLKFWWTEGRSGVWTRHIFSPHRSHCSHQLHTLIKRVHIPLATIIYTAILLIISAAHILGMSETSAKHKNAKWNNNEVFWMMEFLAQHASTAGDGGNFPASKYNEAASHLAQYQDSGSDIKTGTKWKQNINW